MKTLLRTELRTLDRCEADPGNTPIWRSAFLPAAICAAALAAVLIALIPGANDWLVFDRARIEAGQFWRLLTGHWVHFSTSHLVWNLVALGAAGTLASGIKARDWPVLMTSAVGIGAAVFLLEPELRWFGGLSGVATAMIAWAVASRAKSQRAFRILALVGILLLTAKLTWEATTTLSVFASFATEGVRTSWIAHLVGMLVGAAFGLVPNQLRFHERNSGLIARSSEIADSQGL